MPIKPTPPRHTVRYLDNGLQVTLSSKKNYFRIVWYGLCLLMWGYMTGIIAYVLALMVISSIAFASEPNGSLTLIVIGFLFIALVVLIWMGVAVIYSFLWQLIGKEVILVSHDVLSISRQIFRWKKVFEYLLANVVDLRVSIPQRFPFALLRIFSGSSKQKGMIAFDYGAKTIRFGFEIEEAEAKQIISALQQYISKPHGDQPS